MKSLFGLSVLLLLNITANAAPKPVQASKTALTIDPRASQIIARSEGVYGRLRSFSITLTSTDTLQNRPASYKTRVQASLQLPLRVATTVGTFEGTGPVRPYSQSLLTAKAYYKSNLGSRATVLPSSSPREQDAFLNLILKEAPGLGFGVAALATPPTLDPKTKKPLHNALSMAKAGILRRLTYQRVREAGSPLDKVTLTVAPPTNSSGAAQLTFEYFFSPRIYLLEKLVIRRLIGDVLRVTTTQFSKPVSNWRGSQSATDAAIYNWASWAPGVPLPAPRAKKVVQVEPKARAIFARAAEFYGDLERLRLEWKSTVSDPNLQSSASPSSSLAYDRAGRMRLAAPEALSSLIVIDGKTLWSLDTSDLVYDEPAKYSTESLQKDDVSDRIQEELQLGDTLTEELAHWLDGTNSLDQEEVENNVESGELLEFRATALPTMSLEGQPCDIVRITTREDNKYNTATGLTTKQTTYWFAQGTGRLLRLQTRSVAGRQKPQVSDIQVTKQEINPIFEAQTFTFTPPKGAIKK